MKTIKFKVWFIKEKRMQLFSSLKDNKFAELLFYDDYDETDLKFLQFTGLFDKNEKEVFDGDIVKFDDGIIMNVFQSEDGSWILDKVDNSYKAFKVYNQKEIIKVIGNKFENPELLEDLK